MFAAAEFTEFSRCLLQGLDTAHLQVVRERSNGGLWELLYTRRIPVIVPY